MDWEKYRKPDGSINLVLAFDEEILLKDLESENWNIDAGYDYLAAIEEKQKIVSRQAAAIAISTAAFFSMLSLKE